MDHDLIVLAQGLYKSFGRLKVLCGIDLTALSRQVVTIIGSSGSGKSTLLRCLNLLETPDAGRLVVTGEELVFGQGADKTKIHQKLLTIRQQVSMVFQNFNLWSRLTVLENVALAPIKVLGLKKNQAHDRAKNYLDKVGILDKANVYPSMLSGGQQQRCAIARALAMEPKLLLFDEPTSALDPELVGEVLKIIHLLVKEERSMLLVTHEIGFAKEVSSHVVFLHQGIVEESGPADKVFNNTDSQRCRQFLDSVL
ncbi:MAG: amino acid ABC transporter ATP-binding protein [Deltaproteobacteria bacterium]|jgi:ABC-type histidine transport system ATPase subunit|nr:amino acid ABC transporter ATP-binding protein [Deltaproteobacteria bacterium]